MLDLAASLVKNFDYQMENFFDEICRENSSMGIDQDVLIKLLLLLNDEPSRGVFELSPDDAKFAADNRTRIESTLLALKKFLRASGNEKWFDVGSGVIRRSAITLYFLAYYIFISRAVTQIYSTYSISLMCVIRILGICLYGSKCPC